MADNSDLETQRIVPMDEDRQNGGDDGMDGVAAAAVNGNGDAEGGGGEIEEEANKPPEWNKNWRHDFKTTQGKMGFALENRRLFHDVTFLVGDGDDREEVRLY